MLIGTLAVDDEGEWLIEVPRLNRRAKGVGDVLAGLLVGHLLAGLSLREAAAKATAETEAIVARLQAQLQWMTVFLTGLL